MPESYERFHDDQHQSPKAVDPLREPAYSDRGNSMRAFTKLAMVLAILGTVTVIHADSGVPAAGTGNGSATTTPTMSVADMLSAAAKLDSQMKSDLNEVMQFKELARKQKDVIKLNCVNDRLIQLKAQLNIADSTNQQLQVSLANNKDDRASLFQQYSDTAAAVKTLRADADSCIGAPDLIKQESGNNAVEHPVIPDDPAVIDPGYTIDWEPPAYASPYN